MSWKCSTIWESEERNWRMRLTWRERRLWNHCRISSRPKGIPPSILRRQSTQLLKTSLQPWGIDLFFENNVNQCPFRIFIITSFTIMNYIILHYRLLMWNCYQNTFLIVPNTFLTANLKIAYKSFIVIYLTRMLCKVCCYILTAN